MKKLHWCMNTVVVACGLAMVTNAFAAETASSPGVNARQRTQQQRVDQGRRTGQLTPEETKKLQAEQKALRTEERAYKADGKLTPAERKDLHGDANRISRDIYREKHDGQRARPTLPSRLHDPGVNARQQGEPARIAQGVRSGQLTKAEATGLRQEQRAIRTEERAYKADGKLTAAERKDLHQDLQQASKDIYQEKHDAETRPTPRPSVSRTAPK
jgi:hypothetical protein